MTIFTLDQLIFQEKYIELYVLYNVELGSEGTKNNKMGLLNLEW